MNTNIKVGDYIEGYEVVGPPGFEIKKKMRIIVDKIYNNGTDTSYYGRADDCYGGARGGTIHTKYGEVKKLECEPFSEFWWACKDAK